MPVGVMSKPQVGDREAAKVIIALGNRLFEQKTPLLTLWQEMAEQFYPERADFTVKRVISDEFASHLNNSAPLLARRDLADAISSMLRRGKWFHARAQREDIEDHAAKKWLENATEVQARAMNDRMAQLKRATKTADNDYVSFGQAAMQLTTNKERDRLLYRTWHLRDCTWSEDSDGTIGQFHRNWNPRMDELAEMFGDDIHQQLKSAIQNDVRGTNRLREVRCRHVVKRGYDRKWCSMYIDLENEHIMEVVELDRFEYIIPRWAMAGSQYAHSPAVMTALPDARLIQAISLTLLEAGERYVRPPMLAMEEVIRSDIQLFSGGVTWVDSSMLEQKGLDHALRPLNQDKAAYPVGFQIHDDTRAAIAEAFYLNKLTLPPLRGHDMTATEVRERVQEYIRQALPLFEPLEDEYNGALCENTFELLFQYGAFGPRSDIPQSLRNQEVRFEFETPLKDAEDSEKAAHFDELVIRLTESMNVDKTLLAEVDFHKAFREAAEGSGAPSDWLFSENEATKRVDQMQQQAAMQEAAEMAQEATA